MKILVTGAYGFIGSNFARMAIELGHQVVGFSRNSNSKNKQRINSIIDNPNFTMINGDMANSNETSELCEGVDVVVNFAAKTFVDHSIRDPKPFVDSNIVGTFNLLESTRRYKPSLYIQVSTDEVYGPIMEGAHTEDSPLNPGNPYCLHPDTEIIMTDGTIKKIKNIEVGDTVLSFDFKKKISVPNKVKTVFKYNTNSLIRFNMDGKVVTCTPQHRFFIKRPKRGNKNKLDDRQDFSSLDIQEVKAKDIKIGDWISSNVKINIKSRPLSKEISRLARLLGYFVGDGYIKKSYAKKSGKIQQTILLADEKKEFVQHYNSFLSNKGCIYKHSTKNCWYTQTGDIETVRLIKSLKLNKKATNKKLPASFLTAPKRFIREFVGGLFDADGSISGHTIDICSYSNKLLEQIKFMLARLGIVSHVFNHKICITDKTSYNSFREQIVCLKEIPKRSGKSQNTYQKNIIWRTLGSIEKIECKDQPVYDLEIENIHNFILANDIITHNSAAKAAGDMLCLSYANTYNIPLIITRTENNYGAFQHPQKAIPVWTRKALANEAIPLYGDGKHIRQWLHVQDHCHAIFHLIENGTPGEIYHVAGNEEYENIEIVNKIIKLTNSKSKIEFINDNEIRPGHDRRYAVSSEKLRMLGWDTRHSVKSGLKQTVDWFKLNEWWWFK